MVSKAGAASAGSVKNSPNMLTLPPPFVLIESGPSQPHAMAVSLSLSLSVSLSLCLSDGFAGFSVSVSRELVIYYHVNFV